MNVNGNRKMCRNIYKLQQALALLTENHESDLIRVKQLYELFYLNPEVSLYLLAFCHLMNRFFKAVFHPCINFRT